MSDLAKNTVAYFDRNSRTECLPFEHDCYNNWYTKNYNNVLGLDPLIEQHILDTKGLFKRPISERDFAVQTIGTIFETRKTSFDLIKCETQMFLSEPSLKKLVP